MSEAREILDHCPLFSRVDDDRKEILIGISQVQNVAKGTLLFRQGDHCRAMYVVGSGQARVFQLNPNGKEHTLYLASPGKTFAEIAAIDGLPYPANAESITACRLLAIDAEGMGYRLETDHLLCRQVMLGMAMWVRHTVALLEDVVLRDAVGRLSHHLLQLPVQDQAAQLPASNLHIAKLLNLTPETFSRSLRRLSDQGLISVQGRQVRLHDRDTLETIAAGLA
jgi:CRP/FNR family transcriptional regulator, dissimilatory nitrate respiration regulator